MFRSALLSALLSVPIASAAQSWPQRPVRVVVNVTPGGGTDGTARAVTQQLNTVFKQPFIIDNRAGAGGSIGIETVAKAAPDGYTLLVCSVGILTNAAFRPQNYDPVRDFQGVSKLRGSSYLLVTTPSLPVKSVSDLVAMARAKPGGVSYATSGVGGITHLGAELLAMLSGTKMLSVPYKGVADGYPAVASGDVNWMMGSSFSAMPLARAGRLRALAITTAKRSKSLPDIPTVAESGVPGYELLGWIALLAPAGTPLPLARAISVEAGRAMRNPEFARRAEADGAEIIASTPEELNRSLKTEMQIWRDVVAKAGIKL